jgi:hypothetical protein
LEQTVETRNEGEYGGEVRIYLTHVRENVQRSKESGIQKEGVSGVQYD